MELPSYLDYFSRVRVMSYDIQQNPEILERLIKRGFTWVRRIHRQHFEQIVREPTIGCSLEFTQVKDIYCVPISSQAGRNLISRKCYF